MNRVLIACLIAIGFAAPAQAWWSKGTLPPCDAPECHCRASSSRSSAYADRRTFHWGVDISQVEDIYETPEIIRELEPDRPPLLPRHGAGSPTAGAKRSPTWSNRSRASRRSRWRVESCLPRLRPLARLRRLVPLDRTVRRLAAALRRCAGHLDGGAGAGPSRAISTSTSSPSPGRRATARPRDRPDPTQCDVGGKGFVVHGLWPQYERGYPEYCAETTRLPRSIVAERRRPDVARPCPVPVGEAWRLRRAAAGAVFRARPPRL